jgi:RHS repeat-associated protein
MNTLKGIAAALALSFTILALKVSAQLNLIGPTFPSTNTVRLTLTGAQATNAHLIFFTPILYPDGADWIRYFTGTVGQTTFDLARPTNEHAFFRAATIPVLIPTVATPLFSLPGGAYSTPTNVTITCATEGAAIFYTTNGATPTTSDFFIFSGGSLHLNRTITLKAKAFRSGYEDSAVESATYTINSPPVVTAGPQQIIATSITTLQGHVSDDGLPSGGALTATWSKVSGPGTVNFGNASLTNTTATFSANGIYVLQLVANDGQYSATNRVTIGVNPAISVTLISPANNASFTVPTNFVLLATASTTSGSITQVAFYAGETLLGIDTTEPFSFEWRSVPTGTHKLTAVVTTTDINHFSLASEPVQVTVDWPSEVGQFAAAFEDINIPVAGLPISVTRQYASGLNSAGLFGQNWRSAYEMIRIEKAAPLHQGYLAVRSVGADCIVINHQNVVTVKLSETEKYEFRPRVVFRPSGNPCVGSSSVTFMADVRFVFDSLTGFGELASIDAPGDVGMVNNNTIWGDWSGAIITGTYDWEIEPYEPSFTLFTFTAPDGTRYKFNADGSLHQQIDRNNNTLTFQSDGIVHSSGKRVRFTRDGTGRITHLYDPNSLDASGNVTGPAAFVYSYASNGNLTNVAQLIIRSNSTYLNTGFAYTNSSYPHHITSVTDPRGIATLRNEFDSNGRLLRQFDALNRATSFSYDLAGQRQTITDRLDNSTIQNFTASGQLGTLQNAFASVTSYYYDSRGRKVAETNALGEGTTFAYDANDYLIGMTNALGHSSSATYNALGQVLTLVDALGYGTTNGYDAKGNLIAVTNSLGIITRYGYDAQGNQIAETNAFGTAVQAITTQSFNQFGWVTNIVRPLSVTNSYTYDDNGNRLTETTRRTLPNNTIQTMVTTWTYDAPNRVIQTIHPDGATVAVIYNPIGKQAATVDAFGRTNFYSYDAIGLLTNITYADGLFEEFAYDAEGRRTNSVDRALRATSYRYDALGRLHRTTYPDGAFTETTYDSAGRVRTVTERPAANGAPALPAPGLITQFTYDTAGRRIAVTNALGTSVAQGVRYHYDANGNQTNVVDSAGRTNRYTYDKLNRLTQLTYPDNSTERYGYDALDRRIAVTNQANVVTRFGYDLLGRLVAVTNAFGSAQAMNTRYQYDQIGNLTNQIDHLSRSTKFEYDSMGRRTRRILPGNESERFVYDAAGNLIRHTNFNNIVVEKKYDVLNRLTNKASGSFAISYGWSPTGQRTNMVDASGTTVFTYDLRDRLLSKDTPQGRLNYTYDSYGNLGSIESTNSSGTKISYQYDALNRLVSATDRFNNTTTYGYNAAGSLQTVIYPNGVTNTYSYNSLNRLTNITAATSSGTIASFAYTLAAAGNRTALSESIAGTARSFNWGYDAQYRLTSEQISGAAPTGTVTYQYDGVGNRTNRTSSVAGVSSATYTYNSNDRLTTDTYDTNGSTTASGGISYQYDALARLTNYNSGAAAFVYDGDGHRVRKTAGGVTTYYLVDDRNPTGYAQVLEEFTSFGSAPARLYTYGHDLISQRQSNGTTHYYGYDGNGNTRYLTGSAGTITDTYVYDAFGIQIASTGSTPNHYRYAGEQLDANLGFYYLRARYLNQTTGRFWTRDPFEGLEADPLSLHKYIYAHGNPVNGSDPSGLFYSATEVSVALGMNVAISAYFTYQVATPVVSRVRNQSLELELQSLIEKYGQFGCVEFVIEAAELLAKKGRRENVDWKIIYYESLNPFGIYGEIWADKGFGRFGGQIIAESGIHAGLLLYHRGELTQEVVSDNNVLLRPRYEWTNRYLVYDVPITPDQRQISMRQADAKKIGQIREISLQTFRNRYR